MCLYFLFVLCCVSFGFFFHLLMIYLFIRVHEVTHFWQMHLHCTWKQQKTNGCDNFVHKNSFHFEKFSPSHQFQFPPYFSFHCVHRPFPTFSYALSYKVINPSLFTHPHTHYTLISHTCRSMFVSHNSNDIKMLFLWMYVIYRNKFISFV